MNPSPGRGHAPSPSAAFRGRDSRVVSIYDKYLYDPKDLESSDPRRRELARKASRMRLQGRAADVREANGQPTQQRKSIMFANGTKGHDRAGPTKPEQSRESGAWGLGMGMLDGNSSESDSDSDNEARGARRAQPHAGPPPAQVQPLDIRDSWGERAAAVGQRPPDSASQNPPSLKLLSLKSAKNGGSIPPAPNSRQLDANYGRAADRQDRILSTSDYGDNTSRHGSTINFGTGLGRDSYDSARGPSPQPNAMQAPPSNSRGGQPASPTTELTRQLGLTNSNTQPSTAQEQTGYFDSGRQQQSSPPSGPMRGPNAMQDAMQNPFSEHAQNPQQYGGAPSPVAPPHSPSYGPGGPGGGQRGPGGAPHQGHGMPSPGMVPPSPYSRPDGMSRGPNGPNGHSQMPPNVLQRGGPPAFGNGAGPQGPMLSPSRGPTRYADGRAPSPVGQARGPSPGPGGMRGPMPGGPGGVRGPPPGPGPGGPRGPAPSGGPPQGPNGFYQGPPPPQAGMGPRPGFSDSPGPQKRQSIFRRSMAFLDAGAGGPEQGRQGPPGQRGPDGAPIAKRQSIFRRSMAFLGGNGGNRGNRGPPPAPRPDPAPRVKGFQDDSEQPDHSRKSQFLGDSGKGFEWDSQGEGAKFWRRFSMAQKNEHTAKLEDGSRAWRETMRMGRKKLIVLTTISLLLFVGAIVAIIVWREIVSPSGKQSDMPGSQYHGNFGDGKPVSDPAITPTGGLFDRRTPQPTATAGLAKRIVAYDVDEHADAAVQIRSLPQHLHSGAARIRRHRRRLEQGADTETLGFQRASLADLD